MALWLADAPVRRLVAGHAFRDELALALLATIGAIVYATIVLALFGRSWFAAFIPRARTAPPPKPGS
jgi:hypothetical protein